MEKNMKKQDNVKPSVHIAIAIPPTHCICGGELEALRPNKEQLAEAGLTRFCALQYSVFGRGHSVIIEAREYDLVECKSCGRAHYQRIKAREIAVMSDPTPAAAGATTPPPTVTSGSEVA